jgi:hypothetical protein
VTERVACAECGRIYDSDENAFCPGCGALERAERPHDAVALARRRDPRRRPVQALGIFMISIGGLAGFMFVLLAVQAPDLLPQAIEAVADMEGGDLSVHVQQAGVPVAGVRVNVTSLDGDVLASAPTDAAGWANFTRLSHAGVNVTVHHVDGEWSRRVLAFDLGGQATRLDVQTEDDRVDEDWVGIDGIVTAIRVLAGVLAAASLVTVGGGIAAVRLRGRQWAIAGAAVALVPALIVALASWVMIVFPAVFATAIVVFVRNRSLFA